VDSLSIFKYNIILSASYLIMHESRNLLYK